MSKQENKDTSNISFTNLNTLKESGATVEFEARKDTRSAEDVYFNKLEEPVKIKLGSDECIEMVKKINGCIDCPNFVKCILNK